MQANEYMKSSVLHPPVKSMRSWGLGGEAVPLETVQMMHEVRERQAAVAGSTAHRRADQGPGGRVAMDESESVVVVDGRAKIVVAC